MNAHYSVPRIRRERRRLGNTSTVDEYVDTAELVEDFSYQACYLMVFGNISPNGECTL